MCLGRGRNLLGTEEEGGERIVIGKRHDPTVQANALKTSQPRNRSCVEVCGFDSDNDPGISRVGPSHNYDRTTYHHLKRSEMPYKLAQSLKRPKTPVTMFDPPIITIYSGRKNKWTITPDYKLVGLSRGV